LDTEFSNSTSNSFGRILVFFDLRISGGIIIAGLR